MQTQEMIERALRAAETTETSLQPTILMNLNIDHEKVAEYKTCYVNEYHETDLTELLAAGWTVFRIQTEFGITGHVTKAYLAKLKAN